MYDQNDGKLIPIESADEFKSGLAAVLLDCMTCGARKHGIIFDSPCPHETHTYRHRIEPSRASTWVSTLRFIHPRFECEDFEFAIKQKRLFKIIDEYKAEDKIENKKKLVKVA